MRKHTCGLYIAFILLLFYPLWGNFTSKALALDGVVTSTQFPVVSLEGVAYGSFQNDLGKWVLENMPGRDFLIRLHGQTLYTLFNSSSNPNVVIGKDHTLFEPEYVVTTLGIKEHTEESVIQELVEKLETLNAQLQAQGKQMHIFITPSKGRYYSEDFPLRYQACANRQERDDYTVFVEKLKKSNLNYFDSIDYINQNRDSFNYPLFYQSGIHWSNALGANVAQAFSEYLRERSGYDLTTLQASCYETLSPADPDADLYKILNVLVPPVGEYYGTEFTTVSGTQQPSVFMRGGSFMGQSIAKLIQNGVFGKSVYFENNYYALDNEWSWNFISTFNAYDEMPVEKYARQSDIFILEVNESKIDVMDWGFIDYLLRLESGADKGAPISTAYLTDSFENMLLSGHQVLSTEINPFGFNIGVIDYESSNHSVLLVPNTAFSARINLDEWTSLDCSYMIHSAVSGASDGCVFQVTVAAEDGTELMRQDYLVNSEQEQNLTIDFSAYDQDSVLVSFSCANEEGHNEECDWLIVKDAMLS